jgi:hypothetical protein
LCPCPASARGVQDPYLRIRLRRKIFNLSVFWTTYLCPSVNREKPPCFHQAAITRAAVSQRKRIYQKVSGLSR